MRTRQSMQPAARHRPAHAAGVLAAVVIALGLALPVHGATSPLDPRWVPADAHWIVHVDVEHAAASDLVRPLLERAIAGTVGQTLDALGLDPAADIQGITAYGTIATATPATATPTDANAPDDASRAETPAPQAGKAEVSTLLVGGRELAQAIQAYARANGAAPLALPRPLESPEVGVSAWAIDRTGLHLGLVPLALTDDSTPHAVVAVVTDGLANLRQAIATVVAPPDDDGIGRDRTPPQPGSVVYAHARGLCHATPAPRSDMLALADLVHADVGYTLVGGRTEAYVNVRIQAREDSHGARVLESMNRAVEFLAENAATLARQDPAMLGVLTLVRSSRIVRQGASVELAVRRLIDRAADPQDTRPPQPGPGGGGPERDRDI